MKKLTHNLAVVLATIFFGCQNKNRDFKKDISGWTYETTFKTLPFHTINQAYKILKTDSGSNDILCVEVIRRVIFKPDVKGASDFVSYDGLLIELDKKDTLISPNNLGSSKIFRRIYEFPNEYHLYSLKPEEKIEVKRIRPNRWKVKSDLVDFQFEGEFSFADSSVIISRHKQMLTKDL